MARGVVGDRKKTDSLVHHLAQLVVQGSVSQKKKSIDFVAHLLHFAETEPLLVELGMSAELGQTLAKLVLLKDQVAIKAAVILKGQCVSVLEKLVNLCCRRLQYCGREQVSSLSRKFWLSR